MSRFLAITREPVFSPGRVEDDGAILAMVAARLRDGGHVVSIVNVDDNHWPEPAEDTVVCVMCQGAPALQRLDEWQRRGVRIINSPTAIRNCQRHRTARAFANAEIPFPETVLLDTRAEPVWPTWVENERAWVKRGDVHATETGDVTPVDSVAAARRALEQLRARGIYRAVVQRHVAGTVLKFYAVHQRFFHCVPSPGSPPIAAEALAQINQLAQRAALVLGVEVYGGDCIYDGSGAICLIDLNDWPSYAPCCARAAEEIAAYLHAQTVARGS